MANEWTHKDGRWVRTTRTHAVLTITENVDPFSYRYTGGYSIPGEDRVDPVTSGSVAQYVREDLEVWAAKYGIIDASDITPTLTRLPE